MPNPHGILARAALAAVSLLLGYATAALGSHTPPAASVGIPGSYQHTVAFQYDPSSHVLRIFVGGIPPD